MEQEWKDFKANPENYNMLRMNCSTVVASLLESGSGVSPTVDKGIQINQWIQSPVKKLFLQLRFLGNHIDMWTPDDVMHYALQIKSHIDSTQS